VCTQRLVISAIVVKWYNRKSDSRLATSASAHMSDLEFAAQLRFVQQDQLGPDTLLGRSRLEPYQELILTPCIELVVLGREQTAPTFLHRPYEQYLSGWRQEIRFWWDGGIKSCRPKASSLDKVGKRLSSSQESCAYNFHAGSSIEMLPPSFEIRIDAKQALDERGGYVSEHFDWHFGIRLPVEYAQRPVSWWKSLISNVTPTSFGSGWVGYSVQWNSGRDSVSKSQEAKRLLRQWFQDNPGLTPGPDSLLPAAKEGIRTIGWLTLLGREITESKNGVATLQKALGTDNVSCLGDGVLIQAGNAPRLRDAAEYRLVGHHLADVRVDHKAFAFHDSGFGGGGIREFLSDEEFDAWVSRFD